MNEDDRCARKIAQIDKENRQHLAPWFDRGGIQAAFLNACLTADVESARMFLDDEPSLANIPSGEVTPMRIAAFYGHAELAELLIRYGAALNTTASERMDYPLHLAAVSGHSAMIKVLVDHGVEVDARDRHEETPLHRAAKMNHKLAIGLLFDAGANPESRDRFLDSTPLQHAICGGNGEAVRELVRLGADVNAETSKTPWLWFRILSENQWPLFDCWEGTRPLHMADCARWPEIIELLLDNGADVNALSFGWSAFHAAVAIPDPRIVELLLQRGADPHVKANLKTLRGQEWNRQSPIEMLVGFKRTADLLRNAE